MTTRFNKAVVFAVLAITMSNAKVEAQSTTTTNNYVSTSFLGWGTTSGDLPFKVNNTTQMTLKNTTGNFGIGNTNPAAKLHVISTVSTTPVAHFQNSTGISGLVVKEDGKVAIGSATGTSYQLDVQAPGLPNTYESIFNFTVSDAVVSGSAVDYVSISNKTNTNGQLVPLISSCYGSSSSNPNLNFRAQTPFGNDIGDEPMAQFDAYLSGSSNLVVNRPLVQFTNMDHIRMSVYPNGSIYSGALVNWLVPAVPAAQLHIVGSGTTSATYTAKFQTNASADILTIRNDKKIVYTDGTQGAGKVLTSDANGVASWQTGGGGGSQWTTTGNNIYYNTGSVGIGTTSPAGRLHTHSSSADNRLYLTNSSTGSTGGDGVLLQADAANAYLWNYENGPFHFGTNAAARMTISSAGNVGIGTTTPVSLVNLQGGSANWSETAPGTSVGTLHLDPGASTDSYGNAITFGASDHGNGELAHAGIYVRSDGNYGTKMYFGTTDSYASGTKMRMMIDHLGGVGIGAPSIPAGYLLAVGGKIIATEVVVRLLPSWPDYVFKKGYKLKTLNELEEYVEANHHLPGIPSAKEIDKDGLSIGDIVTKQMEKIEEMSLYLIEINKKVENLETENKQLKASIKK